MNFGAPESFVIGKRGDPAAPTAASEEVTLFDSSASFGPKMLRQLNATMLEITFNALDQSSATSGLIAYTSNDGGDSWVANTMIDDSGTASMPDTVTYTAMPDTWRWPITGFADFKITFTAGATPPTDSATGWDLTIVLHCGAMAVQR